MAGQAMWSTAESLWMLYDAGRWDEALERAARAIAVGDATGGLAGGDGRPDLLGTDPGASRASSTRPLRSSSDTSRRPGRSATCRSCLRRSSPPPSSRGSGMTRQAAIDRLREFDDATRDGPTEYRELQLPEAIRICRLLGDVELARRSPASRPVFVRPDEERDVERPGVARRDAGRPRARRGDVRGGGRADGKPGATRSSARTPWTGSRDARRRSARTSDAERAREAASAIFAELGVPDAPAVGRSGPCCSPIWSRRPKRSPPRDRDWRRSTPSRSA